MKRVSIAALLVFLVLIFAFVLGGCNMPGRGEDTDTDVLATAARLTVDARLTQAVAETAAASGDVGEQSSESTDGTTETATPTLLITDTPTVPSPQTPTSTPIPCNWVSFVKDVAYPDGSDLIAGTAFTKTWRLKNIGTCTWTSGYRLIFSHGDRMSAPDSVPLTSGAVAPGETVDVSVNLVAPDAPGTYQGNFLIRSPDNVVFGLGPSADQSFWVKIEVFPPASATPTATATATSTPEPPSKPDLVINLLELDPATPTKGNPVDVRVQVYNVGNAVAVGPFIVEWYPGENYPSPACNWTVDNVNPGGGRVLTCTYAGYPSHYASLVTKAIADTTDTVEESNEGNNAMTKTISVDP